MDRKNALIIGASMVISAGIIAFALTSQSSNSEPSIGRYQMGGVPGHAYVLDSSTGQVWEKFASASGGTTSADFNSPKLK